MNFYIFDPLDPYYGGGGQKVQFFFSKSTLYYTQMKGMTQEIIFMELSSSSNRILAGFNCITTILPPPAYTALYMIGYISNKKN